VGGHRLPALARRGHPVTGWAARRFGAKRVYMVSLVLFTAGSGLCAIASSTASLVLFRILQGFGGA